MRRTRLQLLAALALVVAVAAPVTAATPDTTSSETLTGILEVVWVEDIEHGRGHQEFAMRTNRGSWTSSSPVVRRASRQAEPG